jgi:predicted nuclease of predicted toxin-antitoxin system
MFLANENFPNPSIEYLRINGHNVKSIQEEMPAISDEQVIEIAQSQKLIILTFDSDYGELIFKYALENPPSVIYFRDKGDNPEFAGLFLNDLLKQAKINFSSTFTVIEERNIRQRFYRK